MLKKRQVWPGKSVDDPSALAAQHYILLGQPRNPYNYNHPNHEEYERRYEEVRKLIRRANELDKNVVKKWLQNRQRYERRARRQT